MATWGVQGESWGHFLWRPRLSRPWEPQRCVVSSWAAPVDASNYKALTSRLFPATGGSAVLKPGPKKLITLLEWISRWRIRTSLRIIPTRCSISFLGNYLAKTSESFHTAYRAKVLFRVMFLPFPFPLGFDSHLIFTSTLQVHRPKSVITQSHSVLCRNVLKYRFYFVKNWNGNTATVVSFSLSSVTSDPWNQQGSIMPFLILHHKWRGWLPVHLLSVFACD